MPAIMVFPFILISRSSDDTNTHFSTLLVFIFYYYYFGSILCHTLGSQNVKRHGNNGEEPSRVTTCGSRREPFSRGEGQHWYSHRTFRTKWFFNGKFIILSLRKVWLTGGTRSKTSALNFLLIGFENQNELMDVYVFCSGTNKVKPIYVLLIN